jgi:hypothetical protein
VPSTISETPFLVNSSSTSSSCASRPRAALAPRLLGEADHLPRRGRPVDGRPAREREDRQRRHRRRLLHARRGEEHAARAADHDDESRDVDEGGRVAALEDDPEEQHDERAADADGSRLLHLAPLLRIMLRPSMAW